MTWVSAAPERPPPAPRPSLRLRTRISALAAVALVAVALAVVTLAGCGQSGRRPLAPDAHRTVTSPPASPTHAASGAAGWQLRPGEVLIGVATKHVVRVVAAGRATPSWTLRNPNASGAPLVFLVVGSRPGQWEVQVPARPNGARGWVADADVDVQVDPYALRVSLRRHLLTVYRDGARMRSYPVGVGRPSAPTPTGSFYLTELLQAANPGGPYGAYAYGTSAFSDVYSEFEGGPGQIGVHGTDDPSSIGRNVSHGCLRLRDADIRALARVVPAGTPITVTG